MIKTRIIPALVVAAVAFPAAYAGAAEGGSEVIQPVPDISFSFEGPFGTFDKHQLQRGFQVYHEVCRACHGLKYVAFRSLEDETGPAFPKDQVKAIAAQYDVVDKDTGETRAGKPSDHFPAVTSAGAPDLSLMAKARAAWHGPYGSGMNQLFFGKGGPEYIHAILTGFTGKTVDMAGSTFYVNKYFERGNGHIRMPPPLQDGSVEYAMHGEPKGEKVEPPAATLDQESRDVAAFLTWASDPKMVERKQSGLRNVLFLIVLTTLLYFTNKSLWRKVKHKE